MFREKLPPFEPSFVISVGLTLDDMDLIQSWSRKLREQRGTEVTTDEALHFLLWLAGNTEKEEQTQ